MKSGIKRGDKILKHIKAMIGYKNLKLIAISSLLYVDSVVPSS